MYLIFREFHLYLGAIEEIANGESNSCMTLRSCRDKLGRAGLLMLVEASLFLTAESVLAQSNIVPDATLGEESSQIITNVEGNPVEVIEGGAQRGANLFHSFSEFNVNDGRGAYFANPAGIENILGRVTGVNPSHILGTLGVLGNADLFLINPNGIIFGQNARLDVNGSFISSTADSLLFPNGIEFSATDTQTEPLLTVNVPIGLGLGDNPGAIVNRSRVGDSAGNLVGLEVPIGENLTLVGGDISFEGGNATASGGRIELGGLSQAGEITFNDDGSLSFPENAARADVTLNNTADVDVTGTGGGDIAINARNLSLEAGEIGFSGIRAGISADSTDAEAQAGDITINATDNVIVDDSFIANLIEPEAIGNGGNIDITTDSLSLTNSGTVGTGTLGRGNAGLVEITASDTITIDGESSNGISSSISSQASPEAEGNGGDITITTGSLALTNGGTVSASTRGRGDAGLISIAATDTMTIDGESSNGISSSISSQASPEAEGNGGDITITTDSLSLTNGGTVSASTFGRGDAGSVSIAATDTMTIDGESSNGISSSISSQVSPEAEGNGGDITITTGSLSLTNGGGVSASTFGRGNGGDVNIVASQLTLQNQGRLSVGGSGDFNPGNLDITADNISLDNQSFIEANTESGTQGNITLNTQLLTLRNNSNITTNATGTATGGNITINVPDGSIVAVPSENSDITANATVAIRGRIRINARSLFGIEAREAPTPLSDITTTSLDLNVAINAPESGLNELPTVPIDADAIIAQNFCRLENDRIAGGSSFTIIGKGGLPPTADDPIINQTRIVDWAKPAEESFTPSRNQPEINSNNTVTENTQPVIQQARGWAKTKDGKIVLTADAPIIVPQTGEIGYPNCSEN